MHLFLCAVGKWKQHAPEVALYDAYRRRLPWPLELRELPGFPALNGALRQQRETEQLLTVVRDQWHADKVIVLDETGRTISSRTFAATLGAWQEAGERRIACIIGGDVGLEKKQLADADLVLSFGAMTWPHLLVRTLLAEQLYRAHTILTGHPYHRD